MQKYQNFEFEQNMNQYQIAQYIEKIMLLTAEVQSQRDLIQNLDNTKLQENNFFDQENEQSQRRFKQLQSDLQASKNELHLKNQFIFELKEKHKEQNKYLNSLNDQLENYRNQITSKNNESTAVCLLNQELLRYQGQIQQLNLQQELNQQKQLNKIQQIQNEKENIQKEYIDLCSKYQQLRIEFENLQKTIILYQQQNFSINDNKLNTYNNLQFTQDNYNRFSTQTFSHGSSQKKPFKIVRDQKFQEMSQQMSQLLQENFNLKAKIQKNKKEDDKKDSFYNTNQTPKSNKTDSHKNLSVGYKNTTQIATKLNFNEVDNKTNENFEKHDLQTYFQQKQDLYNVLNEQEITLLQKKLYNIKKLNNILEQHIQKRSSTKNDDNKLLKIIQQDQQDLNFESNLDLQLISQNKQQDLDYIISQNEILNQLNQLTQKQINFSKNKQLQLKQKRTEFQNLQNSSESSIIKKPLNQDLQNQKQFIRSLTENYDKEYKKYIELDKTKDQQLQDHQIQDFHLQKYFKTLNDNLVQENGHLKQIKSFMTNLKNQNNKNYTIFQEWIQSENQYGQILTEIFNQQSKLSQDESELLENNQKHLFKVSEQNIQQNDNSKQKLSRSFDPKQYSSLDKSKFRLNQTIGNDLNTQFPSIKLSDYEQSDNFFKFEKQTDPRSQKTQDNMLNLQDSLFQIDQIQNKHINSEVKNKNSQPQKQLQIIKEDMDESPQKQPLVRKKSLSDQKISNQVQQPQFSATKLNQQQNDLDSNIIQSSRTNKTNPYRKYDTFQDPKNQDQNQFQYDNLPSKGSAKSDFSRIFSHIGKIGSKKVTDLNIVHDKQSQKVLINDKDFFDIQEDFKNLEVRMNKYQEIVEKIIIKTSAQNIELDDLPNLIEKLINENYQFKKDFDKSEAQIDKLQKQVENLILEKQEFQELNRQLNYKIQLFQRTNQKYSNNFNKSNPFEDTHNFDSFNGQQKQFKLQQIPSNTIEQNKSQNQSIIESHLQVNNNSKIHELQIEQLIQQNDYLMIRLQEEREKKNFENESQKIKSLDNLLQNCELQLKQFRKNNVYLNEQLQIKTKQIELNEKSFLQNINSKEQKIQFLEQQNNILQKDLDQLEKEIYNNKKNDQINYRLDFEIEKQKNERLQNKLKNLQNQLKTQPNQSSNNNQFDFYVSLIDKLKDENKNQKNKIYKLEKYEDQCKFLEQQLQAYEKDQLENKPTMHINT